MKEVKAYIKPHKLTDVVVALRDIPGMTGISVFDLRGFGRGRAADAKRKIIEDLVAYIPMVKIEIVCSDESMERIVAEIEKTAYTGLRGDGKIYVAEVLSAVRISTGERGEDAL
jgi:nitrogen regulatory protein PII